MSETLLSDFHKDQLRCSTRRKINVKALILTVFFSIELKRELFITGKS